MLHRLADVGWLLMADKTNLADNRQNKNGAGIFFDLLGLSEAELIDVVSSISTTTTRWQKEMIALSLGITMYGCPITIALTRISLREQLRTVEYGKTMTLGSRC